VNDAERDTYSHDPPKTLLNGAVKALPIAFPRPSTPLLISDPIDYKSLNISIIIVNE
jgi:hypothetical protein